MGENSGIEWTDHTWNPWVGCTKISPACDHCYAEGWAKRAGTPDLWQGGRRRTSPKNWAAPHRWNKEAYLSGKRPRVFCASLADFFDNQVDPAWRDDAWRLIAATPHLDWLLLTKRPQNIAKMLPPPDLPAWTSIWPNVWLGTTVSNQEEAERNIPPLLLVPAALRFLSCEPMLGPIDLLEWLDPTGACCGGPAEMQCEDCPSRAPWRGTCMGGFDPAIDWVIAGGESGPHARPVSAQWALELCDQCQRYEVPFFFKQWGEWHADTSLLTEDTGGPPPRHMRVGKKQAGRLIEGKIWDQVPSRVRENTYAE